MEPVFFDPSGRRRRWSFRFRIAFGLLVMLAAAVFAATIVMLPDVGPPDYPRRSEIAINRRSSQYSVRKMLRSWLPSKKTQSGAKPVTVGFYVPWDDTSLASLRAHANQLDWVVPALARVDGDKPRLIVTPDPRFSALLEGVGHQLTVLPMVQNFKEGAWDGAGIATLLRNPASRARLIAASLQFVEAQSGKGIVFDFEDLPASAQDDYQKFVGEAHRDFAAKGLLVSLTVPVGDRDWNLAAYGRLADRVIVMDYDEHYASGDPGPIASQGWFVVQLDNAIRAIGANRTIVALGAYGYDWAKGKPAESLTLEEVWLAARDSSARIEFDQRSGNQTFSYEDENGVAHEVWMLDATSNWNQLKAARGAGVGGVAIWRLGSEDPDFWTALSAVDAGKRPDLTDLQSSANVDVEGNGELFKIDAEPTAGSRRIDFSATGLAVGEVYQQLPTPFVVSKFAARPKQVILTFDDGPDPTWTPPILDVLKAKHAPAAFFVIGENAMLYPGLVRRIVDQGSELGNHSFTHPNLANYAPGPTKFELNTTQRLIEAYTGRSMRLFRAPYIGDAEPTTGDELLPAMTAQRLGYVNVGLHVDPGDWKRPGAEAIVRSTLAQVEGATADRSANIILLHDGGGDRSQTVAALPAIIDGLRARGYEIVSVSQLAGWPSGSTMPVITGPDLWGVRADVGIFLLLAGLEYLLGGIFVVAITLGIVRALTMTALALLNYRRERALAKPTIVPGKFVSVIIPAYNEAAVISASVSRVLASTDVQLEVIVADDGSKDGTGDIVARDFGGDPRVHLLRLENGGKARALNKAVALAKGDIIIALDADTQFEPQTIALLARWFDDPGIGAVAGNAMVGNRLNLVTRWQAIEYITAQNLERRALARFDAMTVVPGAVGAWRREALAGVGYYPEDTLAEDQDLTIAVQRAGWRVAYDHDAVAWTEAPESFSTLARQRYRWAFGTLQCLWKHRAVLKTGRPRGLARIGLPQAWLFQIVFAVISPVIDLALLVSIVSTIVRVLAHGWEQTRGDVGLMAVYWLAFTAIDLACGWVAFRLEPRVKEYPAFLLLAQRFVYRQLMYWVVLQALASALHGPRVGWGKLKRSGSVELANG